MNKVMYIVRGLSGSGKSTLARELGVGGVVYSTDDFFEDKDGKYVFDYTKLGEYHEANQKRAVQAVEDGVSPIVIDNTHIKAWEAKPYVQAAVDHGYEVRFAEPNTPWKFDAEELAKKNSHGVPLETIQTMLTNWEPDLDVDKVLNSVKTESKKHKKPSKPRQKRW